MSYNSDFLSAKYPFIFDDIYLIAQVNKSTGRQMLIMQKIDQRTNRVLLEDRIECIHTAITNITLEEFEDKVAEEGFEEEMLNLRSSENVRRIELVPEEKFFAFNSWVQGIAEAGVNAVSIQENIEHYAHLANPISRRLFNFLLRSKIEFVQEFLSQIERYCHFEGEYHKPSINANLMKLLNIVVLEEKEAWNRWRDVVEVNYEWSDRFDLYLMKQFDEIMESIFELEPSANIFLEEDKYNFILTLPKARMLEDWEKTTKDSVIYNNTFIFSYQDEETGLKALDLSARKIQDLHQIKGLSSFEDLEQLHLENNWLTAIRKSDFPPNLRQLYLNHNSIEKIHDLEDLRQLEVLQFTNNKLEEIVGLDTLTNLKEVFLFENQIKEISGLESLVNLEYLHLSGNQITEIKGLETLKNLKKLILRSNKITQVNGLENLSNLEELDLSYNEIKEKPDLRYLLKLRTIQLNDNPYSAQD